MLNFAQANEIKSLFIDVSEEIENKNLQKFIFTSLKLKNLVIKKNDFVHINFICELKQYQILIFPNHYKNVIFEIFNQFYIDKKELNSFDLYITKEFFCLYKNGKFYYYQNLESEIFVDDLVEYINKIFSIKINIFKIIDETYKEELKNSYLKKSLKNVLLNFNSKKDFSFQIYLIYMLILLLFFIYLYINYKENNKDYKELNSINSVEELKKEYSFDTFSSNFSELISLSQKYNLNLKTFEYKENKVKIILSTSIKSDIYSFFNELKTNLISHDINYFENEKIYESTIYVKLSK
ncbi:MAG: hypothetical protein PHG81_07545 [Aliarcobacter sp.]|nr:hypothetical protein [Aliarcobacter sp.]